MARTRVDETRPDVRAAIRARLIQGWYTADEADRWLASPQPLLDGAVPDALIEAGEADRVRRAIAALDDGVYL